MDQPVRPQISNLQIDSDNLLYPSNASDSGASPSSPSRGRAFSQAILPAFRISTAGPPKNPTQYTPSHSRSNSAQQLDPIGKYRDESRKLLTHVLGQLHNRPKPPSIFDSFRTDTSNAEIKSFRTAVRVVQGAVKLKSTQQRGHRQQPSQFHDDSDEEEDNGVFSTDVTFDLMTQLVSALAVAVKGNWRIFDEE